MGLDMYLKRDGVEVGYWRKANAIHKWFVDNIQDGVDDCDYHRAITKADLECLKDICETIINEYEQCKECADPDLWKEAADEYLPTQSGFFFGSTDYDDWYIDSLRLTVIIVDDIIASTDFSEQEIHYISSW